MRITARVVDAWKPDRRVALYFTLAYEDDGHQRTQFEGPRGKILDTLGVDHEDKLIGLPCLIRLRIFSASLLWSVLRPEVNGLVVYPKLVATARPWPAEPRSGPFGGDGA